jgi:YfiH family protein
MFTRQGGVSQPPFDSLNVGLGVGDDPAAVIENRNRVLSCLGVHRAIFLNQVHGADILVLDRDDPIDPNLFWDSGARHPGSGPLPAKDPVVSDLAMDAVVSNPAKSAVMSNLAADAVVTNLARCALVIQVADCQAVMLADPVRNVIANVHSGWRGSIENIIGRCVDVMIHRFGCDPRHILAGISPSLGPCCAQFIHYRQEIPEPLWQYKFPDRDHFDFWRMSKDQLAEKGVSRHHIFTMSECTRCRPDRYFSYRQAGQTGRFACAIGLA